MKIPIFKTGGQFYHELEFPNGMIQGNKLFDHHVTAQVRKSGSTLTDDLIADLECSWQDEQGKKLVVSSKHTWGWPACLAEFDVLFTDMQGGSVRSEPVVFRIEPGITQRDPFLT